ncbi:MAG TPA: SpoIID/LytB domain-containing protein [Acidimicrobiia bacterium]|jgi:peptidoglycan hydrolase-like amidase|nr:SpoIID/LytB domain-containing protein [Acidimicrobiia bacterium]
MPLLSGNPRRYHQGSLEIRPSGLAPADDTERLAWIVSGPFHVSWSTSLDTYIAGIAEMPSSWPDAALEAQAIAARSCGVARSLSRETGDRTLTFLGDPALSSGRADLCWCHLDDGTADQVYRG